MSQNLSEKDTQKIDKLISKIQIDLEKIQMIIQGGKTSKNIDNKIDTRGAKAYVEGVFDGRFMQADDDENYLVAENYASKSKLVAGDRLKLVFGDDGKYIFKQIQAAPRIRKIGILSGDGQNFKVKIDDKLYNVLKASVTYYKLRNGSKVAVVLPEDSKSNWATIENKII